jgi:hypothetical protein
MTRLLGYDRRATFLATITASAAENTARAAPTTGAIHPAALSAPAIWATRISPMNQISPRGNRPT